MNHLNPNSNYQNNDYMASNNGIRTSNYSVSQVKIKKPKPKVFTKVANKKSLKKLIGNKAENIFDFYAFNANSKYKKYIKFQGVPTNRLIQEALGQFFNGLILVVIERIIAKGGNDHTCEIYLKKMLKKIRDKFALSLISNCLYEDLSEYLSDYLFNSEGYKSQTIDYVNDIIKSKYRLAMEETGQRSQDFDRMEDILRMVGEKSGIEYMLTFAFVQILEEFGINMSICATDLTKNRPVKRKLYDSFALTEESVDFVLVMLRLPKGHNLSFGNRVSSDDESINYEQFLQVNETLEIQNQPPPSFGRNAPDSLFIKNKLPEKIDNLLDQNKSLKSDYNQTLLNYNTEDDYLKSIPLADNSVSDFSLSSSAKSGYPLSNKLANPIPHQQDVPVLEQESRSSRVDYNDQHSQQQRPMNLFNEDDFAFLDRMQKKKEPEVIQVETYPNIHTVEMTSPKLNQAMDPRISHNTQMQERRLSQSPTGPLMPDEFLRQLRANNPIRGSNREEKTIPEPAPIQRESIPTDYNTAQQRMSNAGINTGLEFGDSYEFNNPQFIDNPRISSGIISEKNLPVTRFESSPQDDRREEVVPIPENTTKSNLDLREELQKKQEYADKMIKETNETINKILDKMKHKKERERRKNKKSLEEIEEKIKEYSSSSMSNNRSERQSTQEPVLFNKGFNEEKSNPVADRNIFKMLRFMDINTTFIKTKEKPTKEKKLRELKHDESYLMSPSSSKYKLLICTPSRASPSKAIGKWEKLKSRNPQGTPNKSQVPLQTKSFRQKDFPNASTAPNYWSVNQRNDPSSAKRHLYNIVGGQGQANYHSQRQVSSIREDLGIPQVGFDKRKRVSYNNNFQQRPSFAGRMGNGYNRGMTSAGHSPHTPHSRYLKNLSGGNNGRSFNGGNSYMNLNNNLNLWR